jgi:hypothetical protein
MRIHSGGSFDDEEFVREGGVLVPRNGGHEVGPDDRDLTKSDYVEDPDVDDGVPGTRDDLPYDFGVETAEAADHIIDGPDRVNAGFSGMGATGAAPEGDEPPLGGPEERELWKKQRPLIQEAEAEEGHLAGVEGLDAERVRDAEAEGAEEALPDFPEGSSATGAS